MQSANRSLLPLSAALVCTFAAAAGPATQDIVPLRTATPDLAWTSQNGTPAAESSADGLVLPMPFDTANADRFIWDLKTPLNLAAVPLLEMDLTCENPGAMRSLNVYFESGSGWYATAVPVRRSGRQRVFLACDALEPEGKPAGLGRISRVRISPWRGGGGDARVVIHAFRPALPIVTVLRGTKSLADPAEKRFGDAASRRIHEWLEDAGLPHVTVDEQDFRPDSPARVAILAYNDVLPDSVLRAVETFVKGGGRLIVCYSSDARLGALMGFSIGEYLRLEGDAQWTGFRFEAPGALHLPPRVAQLSSNIRPIAPARADARIVGRWVDDSGRVPSAPAWGMSDTGFWMTHVLSGDDTEGKKDMLAAMVAALHPPAWRWIAEPLLAEAGRIDSFKGFDDAAGAIRAAVAAGGVADPTRVLGLLDRAAAGNAQAAASAARDDWGAALDVSRSVRADLGEAYARIQRPSPGEIAGIWDHSGAGWYPGDWDRTCRVLKDHGITHIFANMVWASQAHYVSAVLPQSFTARAHGDQVAACLKAGRAHELKVHVWKVCWFLEGVTDERRKELESDGALQRNAAGKSLDWLNPAVESNADRELASLVEIAKTYPVDGIHLDYIRYPGVDADFSRASRAAFERASGRRVAAWPTDVRNGGDRAREFGEWRAAVITEFVRRVRRELNAARPGIQLSAAVYANQPDCRISIGQDWGLWLKEGLVDFVVPMNYDENLQRFTARARAHAALPSAGGRILQGIGATSGESRLRADQVIEQVLAARGTGAAGFVLFDMSPTVRDRILPALRLGLTAPGGAGALPSSPSPSPPPPPPSAGPGLNEARLSDLIRSN